MNAESASEKQQANESLQDCRLIINDACDGAWNMAVDEVLLATSAARGEPCLRFYRWARPTVSLGYFQSLEQGQDYTMAAEQSVVRRPTGGGAIVHDAELTYSFCVPKRHALAADPMTLYRAIHGSLVSALADFSVRASISECDSDLRPEEEPFLCFQRKAVGDVLVDGVKIGGSAQRRPSEAILQHGSVLLRASHVAPELPGLQELTGKSIAPDELIKSWSPRMAASLSLRHRKEDLEQPEIEQARRLVHFRHGQADWVARK